MTVTSIEPYPKGKGRVSIYLNEEFAFVLYKGELSQYGLEVGTEVDDELYGRILNETLTTRAKKRGMNLLMKMDRTESDVRRKLSEGGYPPEAVDAAIEYLVSYHYIDDERYASEYIRFKSQSSSRRMITAKLCEKGIDRSIIEDAFRRYDEESATDPEEREHELICKLIAKRCPGGVDNLDHSARQKLFAYLAGKGFSVSSIEKAYHDPDRFT